MYELARSQPDFRAVAAGYLPDIRMVTDSQQLYLATGEVAGWRRAWQGVGG